MDSPQFSCSYYYYPAFVPMNPTPDCVAVMQFTYRFDQNRGVDIEDYEKKIRQALPYLIELIYVQNKQESPQNLETNLQPLTPNP